MPGGRPSKIDQVVLVRDGERVTAGQHVVERMRLGMDKADAADAAGIDRSTLHRWTLAGARFRSQQAQGKLPRPTANQARLIEFCNALERATAEAEADALAVIHGVGAGGGVVTKTTTKVQLVTDPATGEVKEVPVERTIVTETLQPQWTAKAWWLERKRGYVRRMEVTGAEGAPLVPPQEAARGLADSLREYLQGVEDGKAAAAASTKERTTA